MATKNPNKVHHKSDGTSVIEIVRKDGTHHECYLDTADFFAFNVGAYRWYADKGKKNIFYASTNLPRVKGVQPTLRMHMLLTGGEDFDHKDRNGLNNRRGNLRPATRSQQNANQSKKKNNTSGERGVSWHKAIGKYHARVAMNGKRQSLGLFTTLAAAAHAATAARNAAFGEFAA